MAADIAAGWSDAEIKAASSLAWEVCRTTNYLGALKKRGVEMLYCQGSNDNVSPGLIELGRKFPQLPVYIMPGGQHGGAKSGELVLAEVLPQRRLGLPTAKRLIEAHAGQIIIDCPPGGGTRVVIRLPAGAA